MATGTGEGPRVWNIASCREAGPALENKSHWLIGYTADGKHMLTGSDLDTGAVKLWRADFYTGSAPRLTIPHEPLPFTRILARQNSP